MLVWTNKQFPVEMVVSSDCTVIGPSVTLPQSATILELWKDRIELKTVRASISVLHIGI